MANPDILIGDVPGTSLEFHVKLESSQYLRLRHRVRYWGGHWEMTFYLSDADHGSGAVDEWFNGLLMKQIAEYFNGAITFRGVVWEMVRNKDGKRTRRSMNDVYNAVKCVYTPTGSTTQTETAYQENDDSIARYLRKELIIYRENIASSQAIDEATAVLNQKYDAWPEAVGFNAREDGLEVTVFGMGRLLNNLYCTVTTPTGLVQVSTFVDDIYDNDIVTNFDFIELGDLGSNTRQVEREQLEPTRVGDLIDALARAGDATIPYKWGINSDLQFNFTAFDTTPVLEWKGRSKGGIFKVGGSAVTWDAVPGVMTDKTLSELPAISGDFLESRNHQLVTQFTMWQGQDLPQPELEDANEAQLLADVEAYERMITDGNFDRLHTPGSTPGYTGGR